MLKLVVACLFFKNTNGLAETISVAVADWPPHYYKEKPTYGGHAQPVIRLIELAGFKVKFVWYDDWKAAFNTVKAGRHHATPSWRCTAERAAFFYYTAPNLYDPYVFFHLIDTPFTWESLAQLKEWEPIGVTAGYDYGKNFNKAVGQYQIQLHHVRVDKLMLKLLLKERIKLGLFSRDNGLFLMKSQLSREQQQYITYHPKPVVNAIYHIIFSKKNRDNSRIVDKINQQIKKNSTMFEPGLQEIQNNWQGCIKGALNLH